MATDLRVHATDGAQALAAIGAALGKAAVNIEGLCVSGEGSSQSVHVLVEDADKAARTLADHGFPVDAECPAMVLPGVEDRPGYLGELASRLVAAGITIDAAYLATNTRLVFVVRDIDAARQAL